MSSQLVYLIPKKSFEIGTFKKAVTSVLEKEEVIHGYYDEEYQWFAPGKNSHSFFKDKNDGTNPAFEYLEIHDTVNKRIIPDCTSDNYGAKCNKCNTDLDENLSEILTELADTEFENKTESDMTQLTLKCPGCNHVTMIADANFDLPVRFHNQFACFVEIGSEVDENIINAFAQKLDCNFDIIYGRL